METILPSKLGKFGKSSSILVYNRVLENKKDNETFTQPHFTTTIHEEEYNPTTSANPLSRSNEGSNSKVFNLLLSTSHTFRENDN